jgi:hypothetical protein
VLYININFNESQQLSPFYKVDRYLSVKHSNVMCDILNNVHFPVVAHGPVAANR